MRKENENPFLGLFCLKTVPEQRDSQELFAAKATGAILMTEIKNEYFIWSWTLGCSKILNGKQREREREREESKAESIKAS